MFYNFTMKPFTAFWNKHPYTFQAGQIADGNRVIISDDGQNSVLLTDAVADVFAHCLAVDILNHPELNTNFTYNDKGEAVAQEMKQMLVYNNASIDALKLRAKTAPSVPVGYPASLERFLASTGQELEETPVEAEAAVTQELARPVEAPKKRGRPKKSESASPSENVEFAV